MLQDPSHITPSEIVQNIYIEAFEWVEIASVSIHQEWEKWQLTKPLQNGGMYAIRTKSQ